jgi:hypothetical protein
VRRQHLIRVDSSYIFRSVVKVPPAIRRYSEPIAMMCR